MCTTGMNKFLAQFKHPAEAINSKLDKEAMKRMEDNRYAKSKYLPAMATEMIKLIFLTVTAKGRKHR